MRKRVDNFISTWYSKHRDYYAGKTYSCSKIDKYIYGLPTGQNLSSRILSTCNDNIRESFRNKSFPRYNRMGRIRLVKNHKFKFNGERFDITTKEFDFTNYKFKDIIELNNRFHVEGEGPLPLKTSETCRLIGVYLGKLRKMRYTPTYSADYLAKHYLESVSNDFKQVMSDKIYEVHPGSWACASKNLSTMSKSSGKFYSCKDIIDGYFSRIGIDLFLPNLGTIKPEYLLGVKSKPNSYPGILTAEHFGNKRKYSVPFTKGFAYEYMKTIMDSSEQILDCSLLYVGGREKRMKGTSGQPKDVSTRIVLGQEDVPSLISITLSKILNEGFQKMDKGFNYGGRVNGRLNYRDLSDILMIDDTKELNINADFSSHDCMVHEPAIVSAFAMLRLCFDDDIRIDRLFYYVMSGMIFKRIVLPESRLIYQISKGVATGHGLTNIVTTMCSYGTFSTGMNKTMNRREIKESYLVMAGDDVLGKMAYKKINALALELRENSGMVIDDITQSSGHLNSENGVSINTFLKKKYTYHGLSWNDVELFTNLSYPTSTKLSNSRRIDNYQQMVTQAPFDQVLNNVLKNLIILTVFSEVNIKLKPLLDEPPNKLFNIIKSVKGYEHRNGVIDYKTLFPDKYYLPTSKTNYKNIVRVDHYLDNILHQFDQKIDERTNWFTLRRDYKRMESVVRLKVFDVNKRYFKAKNVSDAVVTFDRYRYMINLYSQNVTQ